MTVAQLKAKRETLESLPDIPTLAAQRSRILKEIENICRELALLQNSRYRST